MPVTELSGTLRQEHFIYIHIRRLVATLFPLFQLYLVLREGLHEMCLIEERVVPIQLSQLLIHSKKEEDKSNINLL